MRHCLVVVLGIIFMMTSCSAPKDVKKFEKLLKQGEVVQKSFKKTIPFEYRNGLVIIEVAIEGKTYDFLVDTGASNIITKELQDELQLPVIGQQPITAAKGESKDQDIIAFNNVSIAGLNFENTIGAVVDLNAVQKIKELKIDGIVGSNLMRHAVWDFNFPEKTITITDSEKALNIPKTYKKSRFFIGYQGCPYVTTKLNGEKIFSTTIDFGFNGAIMMNKKHFAFLKAKDKMGDYSIGHGVSGTGAYGYGEAADLYKAKLGSFEFGNLAFENTIVSFGGTSSRLIGMEFFKNYRIIINWKSRQLKFIEKSVYKNSEFNSFGFASLVRKETLNVGVIYEGSSASDNNLQLGDEVVAVNGVDFSQMKLAEKLIKYNAVINDKSAKIMELSVLRKGQILEMELEKRKLL